MREAVTAPDSSSVKPRLRGRVHQVAFIVSIPAGTLLVALGRTPAARASSAVYAIALAAMLGTSASYHRYPWSPAARGRMQRLDVGHHVRGAVANLRARGPVGARVIVGLFLFRTV